MENIDGFFEYLDSIYYLSKVSNGSQYQLKKGYCPTCGKEKHDLKLFVNANNGLGDCKHCGWGFNPTSFVMVMEGCTYEDARDVVCGDGFDRLEENEKGVEEQCVIPYPPNCVSALQHPIAINYMMSRKISISAAEHFCVNFCTDNFVFNSKPVYVKNRLIFPFFENGDVIGWQGRDTTGLSKLKYFTPTGFDKSKHLFHLDYIVDKKCNNVILCEGVMDVIGWYQSGFPFAVAAFGKSISDYQVNKLVDSGVKTVYVALDGDAIEQKKRFFEQYSFLFDKVVFVDLGEKDADEMTKDELSVAFKHASPFDFGEYVSKKMECVF